MAPSKKRIVILGGGFAGVYTAMHLRKSRAAKRGELDIKLVSEDNYMVFQPLLPQVISDTIGIVHAISPIRRLARNTELFTREVSQIDLENKRVLLAPGYKPKPLTLEYDQLVLALGTQLDCSKIAGMREHAIPFKYLGDTLRLRNHLVDVLEEADNETDPKEKQKLLTFLVAGGGFSGVECIAELNDFVRDAIRAFAHIRPEELRVILLQSADRILPEMTEGLAAFAHKILEKRGVDIRLHTRLQAVSPNLASYLDEQSKETVRVESRTIIATVPAGPRPIVATLPMELQRGRVPTDEYLAVPGWPGVWAVGDCASIVSDGEVSPPTAQHAIRQAETCAHNISADILGTEKRIFAFGGLGKLGSLGRRTAVAEVMGVKISGILAWLLWRGIYLAKMPGLDRKIHILFDWMLALFLPKDITQIRIFEPEPVLQEHFEPGETIFEQGDFGDKLYAIVNGEAEIVQNGEKIRELGQGEIFGEVALMGTVERTAGVRAKSAVDLVAFNRDAFNRIVKHLPGVREEFEKRKLGTYEDLCSPNRISS